MQIASQKKITIFNIYRCWEPYDVWALSNKGLLDWMDKENVEYFCCYSSYKCVVAPNWNWNRGISIPAPRYEQTAALCLVWLHQGRLTLRWQQQQHSPLKPQHLRTRLQKQLCQHPTATVQQTVMVLRMSETDDVLPCYETHLWEHHEKTRACVRCVCRTLCIYHHTWSLFLFERRNQSGENPQESGVVILSGSQRGLCKQQHGSVGRMISVHLLI